MLVEIDICLLMSTDDVVLIGLMLLVKTLYLSLNI